MELKLDELRRLRSTAKRLSESLVDDLNTFVHGLDGQTFVRLPTSKHEQQKNGKPDVGVTVTCSCLMALALTERLKDFSNKRKQLRSIPEWDPKEVFRFVLEDNLWTSSGLVQMNAFTSTLVLRTFGFLVDRGVFDSSDSKSLKHLGEKHQRNEGKPVPMPDGKNVWSLKDIFDGMAIPPENGLKVEDYSTTAAIVYWFTDAIQRGKIAKELSTDFWENMARWAATEFWKQESLVVAGNEALMDPVAMAMAACVCKKLRTLSKECNSGVNPYYLRLLPSETELEFSIELLFKMQGASGIWSKYFPLFHYPDAGANFCFTFEMLEAVLNEFGKKEDFRIWDIPGAFQGLLKAVNWCERNRFEFEYNNKTYTGWNSGGQRDTLMSGRPESWATAVVHMFLWEVEETLSRKIQQNLLFIYKAKEFKKDEQAFSKFLDIEVLIRKKPIGLVDLIKNHILEPVLQSKSSVRQKGLPGKVSALLFGPPGTSKTDLCKAVAKRLGWPLVEIDPSHFLKMGLERISVQADEIFADLMDLTEVVVLFDEMDAMVQSRDDEEARLDVTSQLLTTSMLPKLTKLHDQKRVVFFMATNFQNRFDPAIKRSGRFDLLICMGPPTLKSKVQGIQRFFEDRLEEAELKKCISILEKFTTPSDIAQALELFTFGEFKNFITGIKEREKSLSVCLDNLKLSGFRKKVQTESEFNILRIPDLKRAFTKYKANSIVELQKRTDLTFESIERNKLSLSLSLRYVADKRQSKVQA